MPGQADDVGHRREEHGGLASGEIPGPDFFVRTVPWFRRKRLRDTFHRTMESTKRCQHSGGSRWQRSCHSMNRDRAGRCWASAPMVGACLRPNMFSMQGMQRLDPMRGITCGLGITRVRCRTRRKIKRNRPHGRSARPRSARELEGREISRAHRADAWGRCAGDDPAALPHFYRMPDGVGASWRIGSVASSRRATT
jgi:hypothetical protein